MVSLLSSPPSDATDGAPEQGRLRRVVDLVVRRPVLAVFALALLVRVALAIGSFVVMSGPLVPDEGQYVDLANAVSNEHGAEVWFPGYGQSLYRSTYAYSAPLARLYDVFPANRLTGSLLSAVFGAITAAATVLIARRVVSRRWAMVAGMIVGLLPSQVYWSSASIRESMVWACLAVAGAALATALGGERRQLLLGMAVAGVALLPLAWLRDQTLVVAIWALLVAAILLGRHLRWTRIAAALAIFVIVPTLGGLGSGGIDLIARAIPQLGSMRTYLSMSADSAITPTTILQAAPPSGPSGPSGGTRPSGPSGGTRPSGPSGGTPPTLPSQGQQIPPVTTTTAPPAGTSVITDANGAKLLADETPEASLKQLPRGLVATIARPFPWEVSSSTGETMAKLENLLWFALYALAAVGVWAGWRRRRSFIMFPLICAGALIAMSGVSQGNVGTAFRHRAQVLWALAVIAVIGLEHLVSVRRRRSQPAIEV